MAFDISVFSAEVAKNGMLRNNKFDVMFPMPPGLQSSGAAQGQTTATNRVLNLYCEECNLPGAAMMALDVRRYAYGATEKRPFAPAFTDVNMVVRVDAKGLTHAYFHNWMRMAVCYEAGPQGVLMNQQPVGSINNQFLWELGYKSDYAVPVKITAYDDAGGHPIVITLTQAFPIFVGDLSMNWASRGEYAKLPLTISFFDWSAEAKVASASTNIPQSPNTPPVNNSPGGGVNPTLPL